MASRRFKQVDVFTARPLAGNAVAVVLDADGLDDATMQLLAAWTNLSETTFVLPPTTADADYRLRIFTPRSELPFAGHPTIGSAHAVLEAGIARARGGVLRQECRAGILPIRVDDGRLMVRVPDPTIRPEAIADATALGAMVNAPIRGLPRAVDCGPVWLVAQVADEAALRGLVPDLAAIDRLSRAHGLTGVTLFALRTDATTPVVVRSFAPAAGVNEDPVCGSGNASVAAYLADAGLLERTGPRYRATQGREVGRDGIVEVAVGPAGRPIEIGGTSVTVIDGTLAVPSSSSGSA
jgi:PhzF family phenazine biosynthesis protein